MEANIKFGLPSGGEQTRLELTKAEWRRWREGCLRAGRRDALAEAVPAKQAVQPRSRVRAKQGTEGPNPLLHARFPNYLGNQKVRNEVANLPQQIQLGTRWNVSIVFFHPCRVAALHRTFHLFLISCGMAVKEICKYRRLKRERCSAPIK
jgi:hypothetical protein